MVKGTVWVRQNFLAPWSRRVQVRIATSLVDWGIRIIMRLTGVMAFDFRWNRDKRPGFFKITSANVKEVFGEPNSN